jgi:L-alanine-DL-glutamate epimerase-like enolase superfamily enzyme
MLGVNDIRDYDLFLKQRIVGFRTKLKDWLAPYKLTLAEARVHRVLVPMVGVYTPGWQALPACSWAFVELVTNQGITGTGEWSVELPEKTSRVLDELRGKPDRNLLEMELEEPLYMAWWDLIGQVLGKPLHKLWAELFERGFTPPNRVPMAAYTWQRFADRHGRDAVTFENWPQHAKMRAEQGFPAIKLSLCAYQPESHIELIHRVRQAIGPKVLLRFDPHGTWNFQEARRILRAVEDCDIEFAEQPMNALLPQRFYPPDEALPDRSPLAGSYQGEFYFRHMTQLRREQPIPLSCHWWTPPLVHEPGTSVMANRWEPNWHLLERYDAADISSPDIGLGPWGLWRLYELSRFMGMHRTLHSNFEMCLQLYFRCAMASALMYDGDSVGLYLGTTPRGCHAIDNETIQVADDVIEGGQFDWSGGHLQLTDRPGHGLRLDPKRLERYAYNHVAAAPYRAQSQALYANYLLDRPRTTTQAGWPKAGGPEHFDRQTYPYRIDQILNAQTKPQDVDVRLNRDVST